MTTEHGVTRGGVETVIISTVHREVEGGGDSTNQILCLPLLSQRQIIET